MSPSCRLGASPLAGVVQSSNLRGDLRAFKKVWSRDTGLFKLRGLVLVVPATRCAVSVMKRSQARCTVSGL